MANRTQGLVSAYEKWRMDSDTDIETLTAENARLSGLAANEVLRTARLSAENAILREAITECIGILALQHYDKYIAEARILHATNDCKCKIAATLRIARAALAKGE